MTNISTNISHEEVLTTARNSQIDVHMSELPSLAQHIGNVLSYARRVNDIATTNTSIDYDTNNSMKNSNVFRCDVAAATIHTEFLLQRAPEREGNFFVVPVILEHK